VCLFTHVAAGAVAGALSPSPLAAPFAALLSHVVLDVVPHLDLERMRDEFIFAGVAIAVIAAGGALSLKVALGIAFGILPDFENLLWKLGRIRDGQKVFPGHRRLIPHGAVTGAWSLYAQAAVAAGLVTFLIRRGA